MRVQKSGQISIFVLLGILLILIVSIFLFNPEKNVQLGQLKDLSEQDAAVKIWMDECIKQAAVQTGYQFGYSQGYFSFPDSYLLTDENTIAYYYDKDPIQMDRSFFEDELSDFMELSIHDLCADFSLFEEQGYTISSGNISSRASISDDSVLFDIYYPLSIEKEEKSQLDRFLYTLPFRIGHVLDVSRKLVESVEKRPYALDLTLLAEQDVDVSVFRYDECNQIYIISDQESRLQQADDPYVHSFAVGFAEQYCVPEAKTDDISLELSIQRNRHPVLEPISLLEAQVGEPFFYQLKAIDPDGDTLFYHTSGILKNHTHILDGTIQFTPKKLGTHSINVSVIDLKGGIAQLEVMLEIR